MAKFAIGEHREVSSTRRAQEIRQILFLIDQLETLQGGAEGALFKLTRLLDSSRYQPMVVVLNKPADHSCLSRFGCPVEVLGISRTYGWSAIRAARRLRRIIRDRKVSLVQTFFESSDLWGAPIARLSGCRVLISSRRDLGFRRRPLHHIAYRALRPLFDCVHAVSEPVRDYAVRHDGIDARRVITIPNGVDLANLEKVPGQPETAEFRSRHGLENASHLIVDVTTVRRVKGIDVMMRAATIVRHEFPNAVFLVAGSVLEEAYFGELQSLLKTLNLERTFRFLGGVSDVFPLLASSNVFCHLSRSDGMSNALLEAMASGLACVVSRCGGNPEVVGESGFVVEVEDAQTAAEGILSFLRSPDLAWVSGQRARKIVHERFSAEAMVQDFMHLYDFLLQS